MRKIPKRVHEGLAVFTYVKGKEMPHFIVPWPTSSKDGELVGTIPLGEVP